jgi:hypothetical protein
LEALRDPDPEISFSQGYPLTLSGSRFKTETKVFPSGGKERPSRGPAW